MKLHHTVPYQNCLSFFLFFFFSETSWKLQYFTQALLNCQGKRCVGLDMFFKGQIGTAVIRLSGELQLKLLILAWRSALAGHPECVSGASEAAATSERAHKHWTPLFFLLYFWSCSSNTERADTARSCGIDVPSGHFSHWSPNDSLNPKKPCDSYQFVVANSAAYEKRWSGCFVFTTVLPSTALLLKVVWSVGFGRK